MNLQDYKDGENCINVFSRGNTELGKLLSNFAHTPFEFNGKKFQSVEGFWYWYSCGEEPIMLNLYGSEAKKVGRALSRTRSISPEILKQVYLAKLKFNPEIEKLLKQLTLPFVHFYVMYGKRVATNHSWTVDLWDEIRKELNLN